jgi:hypothetical protein
MKGERPHDDDEREHDEVRDLVKRALSNDTLARSAPDLLRGVQRRIRLRSRGKFFARGWSTSHVRQARIIYVIVALFTLVLAAVAYFGLVPVDIR